MERWLDYEDYLDEMEKLEEKEKEAEYKLNQQEKHDE